MIILIKLLLAHLIGDFFLQTGTWIRDKEEKKFKSAKLYIHALLHGALTMLLIWDINFWKPAVILVVTHAVIDGLKLTFQNARNNKYLFVADQAMHLLVIGILWYYWVDYSFVPEMVFSVQHLILLTAVLIVTLPSSILIKIIISQWEPDTGVKENESLQHAGKYIGILERLFVLVFILTGHWEGVGFLIAAKSVFRFGDLRESKDRKLTEYILVGTLLSFGIAIFIGMMTLYLIGLPSAICDL